MIDPRQWNQNPITAAPCRTNWPNRRRGDDKALIGHGTSRGSKMKQPKLHSAKLKGWGPIVCTCCAWISDIIPSCSTNDASQTCPSFELAGNRHWVCPAVTLDSDWAPSSVLKAMCLWAVTRGFPQSTSGNVCTLGIETGFKHHKKLWCVATRTIVCKFRYCACIDATLLFILIGVAGWTGRKARVWGVCLLVSFWIFNGKGS